MPVAVIAVAASLIFWVLPQAISATINQTINSVIHISQIPKFTGSINVGQTIKNLNESKVSFPQAAAIAAKQITNGTVVGGHLGIVKGYLVYTFFAMNPQTDTGHFIIVDAGNGHVIYTSQGIAIGSLASQNFRLYAYKPGGFGHGFGFWHGPFGAWEGHASLQHHYPGELIH